MKHVIIIPALNPSSAIVDLARDLRAEGADRILVVNDGSDPAYEPLFGTLRAEGATVVDHAVNHGKGAACKTGISFARELWPDAPGVVTVDADGQHLPADVAQVAREAEAMPHALVLGVRDFSGMDVPVRSRLGNAFSAAYFTLTTGLVVNDTQTGLRAIPAELLDEALTCPGDRFDWEMAFLEQVARERRDLWLVPIRTVYLEGNRSSHFRPVRDSARIFAPALRFVAASALCAAIDLGLFALLSAVLPLGQAAAIVVATMVARLSSACANFALNRSWSFRSNGAVRVQAPRYALLCVGQALCSAALVAILAQLGLDATFAKVAVDSCLAPVSFGIQRAWVFAPEAPALCAVGQDAPRAVLAPVAEH